MTAYDPQGFASALTDMRHVCVCSHVDPDGDAIGSVLGAIHILDSLDIEAIPTLADDRPAPSTYAFLPGFDRFVKASEVGPIDGFLALDTPILDRLGDAQGLTKNTTVLAIDHHPDHQRFADHSLVDPSRAAVGQMLWDLLEILDVTPNRDIASCLYTALLTDTGRFQYSNTDADVLRTAAAMVEAGADVNNIFQHVYETRSLGAITLAGRVMSRISTANQDRVAYSWVTTVDYADTGAIPSEAENLVDVIRALVGIEIAFFIRVEPDACRISLRSKSGYDVGSVARRFGGGGHMAAAGLTFPGTMEEAIAALLPLLPGGE